VRIVIAQSQNRFFLFSFLFCFHLCKQTSRYWQNNQTKWRQSIEPTCSNCF